MSTYLSIAQLLIAILLIGVILMQVRGAGLGGIFGSATSVFRTRRGLEKTLFQFTIILVILFIIISIIAVRIH